MAASRLTVLIDYEAGNLHSASKGLSRAADDLGLDLDVVTTTEPELVARADRIVLPGDGAFCAAHQGLRAVEGLHEALTQRVLHERVPFLGICVGMQLLAQWGHEGGQGCEGLGWIAGQIMPLSRTTSAVKIPHMGWNEVQWARPHPICPPAVQDTHAYFLHSYHFAVENPRHVLASAEHGQRFAAIVGRDNIVGVQFHPEKSQSFGIALLAAFLQWDGREGEEALKAS